jgi:hypothetical protein
MPALAGINVLGSIPAGSAPGATGRAAAGHSVASVVDPERSVP